MAYLLADTVVHAGGASYWLAAGSELPAEFVGLVGEHLLDGAVEVPVAEPAPAPEPVEGEVEEAPAEPDEGEADVEPEETEAKASKPKRGSRSGK